jgi:hypothetical protein
LDAHRNGQLEARDAGRAGTVDDEPAALQVATGQLDRIDQAGGGDDRRAVLIVVEHGNVEQLLQPLFDDEAVGRPDILEIDAAERGTEVAHRIDELLGVFGIDQQVDGIDVGKALEERGLALHHRLGRQRAEIAEPEDGRAV